MRRQITITEVAKRAKVSKATVSRAINNSKSVKPQTRQLIKDIIKKMNYHPNTAARGIRTKETKTIGVIMPDITNQFFANLVRGMENQTREKEYQIIITNTDEKPLNEKQDIDNVLNQMVDGLIIIGTGKINDYRNMLRTIPTLFVDRFPNENEIEYFDTVLVNNTQGSFNAVDNLIQHGAERIGFINTSIPNINAERLKGYRKALEENEISYDKDIVKQASNQENDIEKLTGQLIINQACDAIFVANNTIFDRVLLKIKHSNLKGIALGTFDDNYYYQFLDHKITVINQPANEMGKQAVIRLIKRINDPDLPIKHIRLDTELKYYNN